MTQSFGCIDHRRLGIGSNRGHVAQLDADRSDDDSTRHRDEHTTAQDRTAECVRAHASTPSTRCQNSKRRTHPTSRPNSTALRGGFSPWLPCPTRPFNSRWPPWASLPDQMARELGRLDAERTSTDDASNEAIENLVESVPLYLRTIASREGLSSLTPQLVADCDLRSNGAVLAAHDMYVFTQAVGVFLETSAGALPRFAGLYPLLPFGRPRPTWTSGVVGAGRRVRRVPQCSGSESTWGQRWM